MFIILVADLKREGILTKNLMTTKPLCAASLCRYQLGDGSIYSIGPSAHTTGRCSIGRHTIKLRVNVLSPDSTNSCKSFMILASEILGLFIQVNKRIFMMKRLRAFTVYGLFDV